MNLKSRKTTFILAGLLLLSASGAGCLDPCGNDIIRSLDSPAKRLKAVIFQRDCGATTGFSTQISIIPVSDKLPRESGNVFVADTDHGKSPSGPGGGPPVDIEWTGEDALHITYDGRARIFLQLGSQMGVAISYSKRTF